MQQANLLNLLAEQSNWDYGLSSSGLWLAAPSQPSANLIADLFFDDLAATAHKLKGKVQISWGDTNPIEIEHWMHEEREQMSSQLLIPSGIQIAQMRLSMPIVQVLLEFAENSSADAGLVRLSDNQQIALTEYAASQVAIADNLEETVQRRREDYWYLPDLENFNRDWRQQLEPNNSNSQIEYSYRARRAPGVDEWLQIVTRYRLIEDDRNILYQVAYSIDVESVASPVT